MCLKIFLALSFFLSERIFSFHFGKLIASRVFLDIHQRLECLQVGSHIAALRLDSRGNSANVAHMAKRQLRTRRIALAVSEEEYSYLVAQQAAHPTAQTLSDYLRSISGLDVAFRAPSPESAPQGAVYPTRQQPAAPEVLTPAHAAPFPRKAPPSPAPPQPRPEGIGPEPPQPTDPPADLLQPAPPQSSPALKSGNAYIDSLLAKVYGKQPAAE